MNDLKGDLQAMYMRAGVKDEGVLFLFTDGQITNEKFLVFINDLLASGRPRGDRPRATGHEENGRPTFLSEANLQGFGAPRQPTHSQSCRHV